MWRADLSIQRPTLLYYACPATFVGLVPRREQRNRKNALEDMFVIGVLRHQECMTLFAPRDIIVTMEALPLLGSCPVARKVITVLLGCMIHQRLWV